MSESPEFSIVIATRGRGALIAPTLASVAAQSLGDFEVLIVSDEPAHPELVETVLRFGPRFRLLQRDEPSGSQAVPNALGWWQARGEYVAYLGHDDVWHPDHLLELSRAFERDPGADFSVSGALVLGPPGAPGPLAWITGIFPSMNRDAPHYHFFPPSSIAHRRDLGARHVGWPDARTCARPVDAQFQLDAVAAGCRFASTGRVTAFKFTAAARYLSYLTPSDAEQAAMVELLADARRADAYIESMTYAALRHDRFMTVTNPPIDPGDSSGWFESSARARGLRTEQLRPLDQQVWLPAGDDLRALDWYPPEGEVRWSGPNPNPRLLIPVAHDGLATICVHVDRFAASDLAEHLTAVVNGVGYPVHWPAGAGSWQSSSVLEIIAPLRADRATVLELRMPRVVATDESPGFGVLLRGVSVHAADAQAQAAPFSVPPVVVEFEGAAQEAMSLAEVTRQRDAAIVERVNIWVEREGLAQRLRSVEESARARRRWPFSRRP